MKKIQKIIMAAGIGLITLAIYSCSKQELAVANPPKIVNLTIEGTTVNDTLQFISDGRIIAQTNTDNGEFSINKMITVKDTEMPVQIRRKTTGDIIATRTILPDVFNQVIGCYYDGEAVYDKTITIKFDAYAGSDQLEILLDGRVISESADISYFSPNEYKAGIIGGKKLLLQVRKKGSTQILKTQEITAEQGDPTIKFYYDGIRIPETINIGTPVNPANMLFSARFLSGLQDIFSGPADLVIYKGIEGSIPDESTDVYNRIELPADGSFNNGIELPPPADGFIYIAKLVKRGTFDLPYSTDAEIKPIRPESGFMDIVFIAGESAKLAISDSKTAIPRGPFMGTTFQVFPTDIKKYFKD